ncbi:MAG: hypothetical protein CMA66_07595, partial [Euryarchaeota archaeon]|nr:hypothetical protein [Euryarchaeota archaeon]
MANDKDFKVKNGVQPTRYVEGLGTVVASTEGYNFSGASYDSVSFSVSGQDADPYGLFFRSDGAKMYVAGDAGNDINEYNLSTPWTVSSASYSQNFSVASQESAPNGVFFKTDGTKMFVVGTATDTVYEYALSSAWDISSASYSSVSFSVGSQDTVPTDISFNTDGTKMFIVGNTGNNVYEYALSSAWVVSSASYTRSFSVASQTTGPQGLFFSSDGLNMVVAGGANVNKYVLSSAFDISSASYSQAFTVSSQEGDPQALFFKSDGTKMYVLGSSSDTVYQYSTAKAIDTLDLSTGSVFNYSPTASKTLKLSNPAATGTNSGATLLVSGNDTAGIAGNFSTRLWTGTGSDVIVQSGVDLTGQGSMVWVKNRSRASTDHTIWTRNDQTGWLKPNTTAAITNQNWVRDWTTTTYTAAGNSTSYASYSGDTYVGWAFKKTANFFDVVTYTGNSTNRTIAHDLGQVPGMIIVKNTSTAGYSWQVYHRSLANTERIELDGTGAKTTGATTYWNSTTATSSVFSIGTHDQVNKTGESYVAYLFGHDTSSGPIQCGSYVGNASSPPQINLGFEPQWVLIKRATAVESWAIFDNKRGVATGGNDAMITVDAFAEYNSANQIEFTSTGFNLTTAGLNVTNTTGTYIYMAIAAEEGASTTYDSSIKWSGGTAPTSPAIGETDVIT